MTLDDYVRWATGAAGGPPATLGDERALFALGLDFAAAAGEVADSFRKLLRAGDGGTQSAAAALGRAIHCWARLAALTGVPPAMLLARSRAHIAWRRAGRPAGGPVPAADGATIDDYAAWAATSDGAAAPGPSDAGALCDLALGFAGDAGEVAGALGKLRDGDTRQAERFVGELGDVAHFWARLALAIGIQPSALLAQSRADTER